MPAKSAIELQVMWNRLLAVVEEQGQTLMRAAFSAMVRECGDISAGIFDLRGRMLAQAQTGTPGHINSMANACPVMIQYFPVESMREGDIYVTNDPWIATGHLNDLLLVAPVFHLGKLVSLTSCTSHLYDIGGRGMSTDNADIFEEGIRIPPMRLVKQGQLNIDLLEIIKANSRTRIQNEGDIYALMACCDVGASRLAGMMSEFSIDSIDELGGYILQTSQRGVEQAIKAIPNGEYINNAVFDGYDFEININARMRITDSCIEVDFNGSSPSSRYGINSPLNYATAYSVFGIRCIVGPDIPNNSGSLLPIQLNVPKGSIINANDPAPVSMRHMIGQMLPDVMLGCLHQALPGKVPAESVACMWNLPLRSTATASIEGKTTAFSTDPTHNGGTGARAEKDGLSATCYPSGVWGSQIESTEATEPLRYLRRELRPDSGGPGRFRGGHGQILEIENREKAPMLMSASFERMVHPALGREGGESGRLGTISLRSGKALSGKGTQEIPGDESLIYYMPGGGGYGLPHARDPERVLRDVRDELLSREAAAIDYAVVIDENLCIDYSTTIAMRDQIDKNLAN
ncbi:MAG: N-methylhydantoinase B [Parasphingorhabdus sp.]|jgi:N-methylhydantoinase B